MRISTDIATSRGLEKALAIAGLLLVMGTFRTLLASGNENRGSGGALFQLVSGSIYLAAMLVLLVRRLPIQAIKTLLIAWPLVALLLLTLASTLWSDAPGTTLRRAIALLLSSSFAVFLYVRFSRGEIFRLFAVSFGIFMTVGILAAGLPGLGLDGQGYWEGTTGHKNVFGRTCALAAVFLLSLGVIERRRFLLFLSGVGLVLVLLSHSATSLISIPASIMIGLPVYLGLGGHIGRFRLKVEVGVLVLAIAALVGFLTVVYAAPLIFEAVGRDPTLTGRTRIWSWAIAQNAGREWLGAGYRAFWIDANTKYFFESFWWRAVDGVRSDTFAGPGHAHSGYVDLYLDLGWLGVVTFSTMIIGTIINLRRTLTEGQYEIGLLFSIITAFLLVYAYAEKSILQQSEDLWFLFTLLYLLPIYERITTRQMATRMAGPELAYIEPLPE